MRVAVVGLGKLGAPLLATLAHKGHEVVGVDIDPKIVAAINAGRSPYVEPDLHELLTKYVDRIQATSDCAQAVRRSEIVFLLVPTPSEPDGGFSCRYVTQAAFQIGEGIRLAEVESRCTGDRKLIVLVSTVMPGQTEGNLIPILESASGTKCGKGFDVCYNPEFIALGSVIRDLLCPDFVLIGESDKQAGDKLENFYRTFCNDAPPIHRMNFVSAEVAKLALNCYVTTKISFANMLDEACELLSGADASRICRAIGEDRRIGHSYLRPGTAYGGPCFPRDCRAFMAMAPNHSLLPKVVDQINCRQTYRLLSRVQQHLAVVEGRVGVLGLSYKPGTPVVEESAGLRLIHALIKSTMVLTDRGREPIVWCPDGMSEAKKVLGDRVEYGESLATTLRKASVIVVTTFHPEFGEILNYPEMVGTVLIDPWGICRGESK